jgi:hypothetical protein
VAESTAKRAENTATTKFTPASRTRTLHPSRTLQAHLCGDAKTDLYPGRICWFSNSDACKKKKARNFMLGVFGAAKAFNMVTRTAQFDFYAALHLLFFVSPIIPLNNCRADLWRLQIRK